MCYLILQKDLINNNFGNKPLNNYEKNLSNEKDPFCLCAVHCNVSEKDTCLEVILVYRDHIFGSTTVMSQGYLKHCDQ